MNGERIAVWVAALAVVAVGWLVWTIQPSPSSQLVVWTLGVVVAAPLAVVAIGWLFATTRT